MWVPEETRDIATIYVLPMCDIQKIHGFYPKNVSIIALPSSSCHIENTIFRKDDFLESSTYRPHGERAKPTHPRRSCSTLNPPRNTCGSLSACVTDSDRSAAMRSCACIIIPDHHSVQRLHVVTSNGLGEASLFGSFSEAALPFARLIILLASS